MTKPVLKYEIFSLSKRIQHALFFIGFTVSFITGTSLPGGNKMLFLVFTKAFGSRDVLYWWHAFFGLTTAMIVVSHLLYLAIRSYIESIPLKYFPLRLGLPDLKQLMLSSVDLITGRPQAPLRYTPFRKLLYWVFLCGGTTIIASGSMVFYWDWFDSSLISSNLEAIISIHGGVVFILAVLVVWHVYEILGGGSRLPLAMAAITGKISESKFRDFYPEDYHRMKEKERKATLELLKSERDKLQGENHAVERAHIEKILDRGNQLAKEGHFPEAASEYKKALEQFPAYSQAQYNLALVLEKAGQSEEALEAYQLFMSIDPFHPLAEKVRDAIARLDRGVM